MAVYLNNAATTWPKPECVPLAMSTFLTQGGANSARGTSSKRDMSTMNLILDCRMKLAEFFGGYDNLNPLLVTFCMNITEAINVVLHGFLRPGMRVLTSSMEHNAVMRPLRALEAQGVEIDVLQADLRGFIHPEDLTAKLNETRYNLAIFSHASNVAGTVQPIHELAEICREHDLPLILDTAQTAGLIKLNASELGLAALCFTGHKGLMGPQGTGGIVWEPEFASRVKPFITGGTGSYSHLEIQPEDMPDKFEAGTPNLPGIAGLNAALDWLNETGITNIANKERETGAYLLDKLKSLDNIILSGMQDTTKRLPVFALNVKNLDNGILADELSIRGFETRPGLHCAPSAHRTLNTFPQGALRVSPGYFTDKNEIDAFITALSEI